MRSFVGWGWGGREGARSVCSDGCGIDPFDWCDREWVWDMVCPGRIGAIASICFTFASGVGPSLVITLAAYGTDYDRSIHICIQYPVQVFLAFLRPAWSASDFSKKLWLPFLTLICSLRRFFPLTVFNLRLLICRKDMVSVLDR